MEQVYGGVEIFFRCIYVKLVVFYWIVVNFVVVFYEGRDYVIFKVQFLSFFYFFCLFFVEEFLEVFREDVNFCVGEVVGCLFWFWFFDEVFNLVVIVYFCYIKVCDVFNWLEGNCYEGVFFFVLFVYVLDVELVDVVVLDNYYRFFYFVVFYCVLDSVVVGGVFIVWYVVDFNFFFKVIFFLQLVVFLKVVKECCVVYIVFNFKVDFFNFVFCEIENGVFQNGFV